MKIGVLGGSFCPPTTAHLQLSHKCLDEKLCDKVIWVPVNDAYGKSTNLPARFRNEMVKLTLENEENISYSLHEQNYDRVVRTLESMKMLQEIYPNDRLVFIAGADKMEYKWFQKEEFVRDFGFIVANRGDVDCETVIRSSKTLFKWHENIAVVDFSSNVSSTVVREQIKNGEQTEYIKSSVMEYIAKNNLFR